MRATLSILGVGIGLTVLAAGPAEGQQRRAPSTPDRMTFELATNDPDAPADKQIRWISARGPIVRETAKDFDEFAKKHPIAGLTIYFDSPGGSINGGLELGDRLRKAEARVSIGRSIPVGPADMQGSTATPPPRRHQLSPNAGQCNSSCSYAFLGGTTRTIPANAHYGVHMFWPSEKSDRLYQQSYGPQDVENAQRTAARIASYVGRMGVDLRLFEIASSVPHKGQMRRLTPREITDFKVASIEHASPTLAREGNWGLVIGKANATLVTGGALKDTQRTGAAYQLEFTCSPTRGFHNARLELSVVTPLPEDRPVAMRRVLLASGDKDAVIAVSGKDIRAIPATFNRIASRGAGAWIAKSGTVVSEVIENAAARPADGLNLKIDEGNDQSFTLAVPLGNFAEQYRPWAAACDSFREPPAPRANEREAPGPTPRRG